jgi:hypothetical protein
MVKKSLESRVAYHLILTGSAGQLSDALDRRIGDFAVLTADQSTSFALPINREMFPDHYRLYQWVESEDLELIRRFEPGTALAGPEILIYRRH